MMWNFHSNIFNNYHDCFVFHDTAGMEKYKSVTQQLYQTMEIFIIVYDLSLDVSTAEQTAYWIDSIHKNCGKLFITFIYILI